MVLDKKKTGFSLIYHEMVPDFAVWVARPCLASKAEWALGDAPEISPDISCGTPALGRHRRPHSGRKVCTRLAHAVVIIIIIIARTNMRNTIVCTWSACEIFCRFKSHQEIITQIVVGNSLSQYTLQMSR